MTSNNIFELTAFAIFMFFSGIAAMRRGIWNYHSKDDYWLNWVEESQISLVNRSKGFEEAQTFRKKIVESKNRNQEVSKNIGTGLMQLTFGVIALILIFMKLQI